MSGDGYRELIRDQSRPLEPIETDAVPRLGRLPDVRCVLFDIYGTMLISGCGEVGTEATVGRSEAIVGAFEAVNVSLDGHPAQIVELLDSVIRDHQDVARGRGIDFPEVDIFTVWTDVLALMAEKNWIDCTDFEQAGSLRGCGGIRCGL